MKSFERKVAAITGAGSGIGRALAVELSKAGAEVALADINGKTADETAEMARALGAKATSASLDVADRVAVYAWADRVAADHGRVNLVFNNAGVALGGTLEGVGYEDFEWLMNVNFWGVVYGTKAFLPHLRESGEGHVVNISSIFGIAAVPGNGTYNASKFAVRGFTEALRQELELTGGGVSATCVHPGGIKNLHRAIESHDGGDSADARQRCGHRPGELREEVHHVARGCRQDNPSRRAEESTPGPRRPRREIPRSFGASIPRRLPAARPFASPKGAHATPARGSSPRAEGERTVTMSRHRLFSQLEK
jgi:NADP-dependent 3-hydroxy acid dehydrogenase YdfG